MKNLTAKALEKIERYGWDIPLPPTTREGADALLMAALADPADRYQLLGRRLTLRVSEPYLVYRSYETVGTWVKVRVDDLNPDRCNGRGRTQVSWIWEVVMDTGHAMTREKIMEVLKICQASGRRDNGLERRIDEAWKRLYGFDNFHTLPYVIRHRDQLLPFEGDIDACIERVELDRIYHPEAQYA